MNEQVDIQARMEQLGRDARAASKVIAIASAAAKQQALQQAANEIADCHQSILAANTRDLAAAEHSQLSHAMLDRLRLNHDRLRSIENSLREIADLPDPVGEVIAHFERPNGLRIDRVRTPLGVIGVVFESRPNVTADAGRSV